MIWVLMLKAFLNSLWRDKMGKKNKTGKKNDRVLKKKIKKK